MEKWCVQINCLWHWSESYEEFLQNKAKRQLRFHSKHASSRNNIFSFKIVYPAHCPTWLLRMWYFLMGEGILASMHTTTHIGCLTENLFQLFKLKQFPASWQGNAECILSVSRVWGCSSELWVLCKGDGLSLTRSSALLSVPQTRVLKCAWESLTVSWSDSSFLFLCPFIRLAFSSHKMLVYSWNNNVLFVL